MKIKKLKWTKNKFKDGSGHWLEANPLDELTFCIEENCPTDGLFMAYYNDDLIIGKFKSLDKAKEKCQLKFEKIIKKCLE